MNIDATEATRLFPLLSDENNMLITAKQGQLDAFIYKLQTNLSVPIVNVSLFSILLNGRKNVITFRKQGIV